MKRATVQRLKQKGWAEEEISRANEIAEARLREDKSRTIVHMNRVLYWMAFFVIVIGNAMIATMLVPVLLVLNRGALDLVIIVLGFAFGLLFNLIITDIEHVTQRHHILIGLLIPAIAVLNLVAIVYLSNALNEALQLNAVRQNPVTVSLIYVIAFIIPFVIGRLRERRF